MKKSREYLIEKCENTNIPEIKYGFEIAKIMEDYAKEYAKEQVSELFGLIEIENLNEI